MNISTILLVALLILGIGIKIQQEIEHRKRSQIAKKSWKNRRTINVYKFGKLEEKLYRRNDPSIKWVGRYE